MDRLCLYLPAKRCDALGAQVVAILQRMGICERASIDECYLDITVEARKRLSNSLGQMPRPGDLSRVHVCGVVSRAALFPSRAPAS